ncbi:MAG: hypothetical protein CMH62_00640 [Nanoarchaeota archaeon]|nr:hypothetical protein [Nanoarchaeota archaeon]
MNKKGISGIIGVVLLALIVIVVGGVIFNWVKGQSEGVMEQSTVISDKLQACQDIDFSVDDAYCDGDVIVIRMSNNKNVDFKDAFSLKLRYEESEEGNEVSVFKFGTELKAYESEEIQALRQFEETEFGKNYFKIENVEIVPRLVLDGEQVFCSDNKQILEAKGC